MKTELSFLLELLLDHKLHKPTQAAVKERIREIEAAPQISIASPGRLFGSPPIQQPSTQALLAKQEAAIQAAESAGIVQAPPTAALPPRIVGGEVATGNGTRGPRKF